jgi:riboflavin kinase / FMN adenylyltransferase
VNPVNIVSSPDALAFKGCVLSIGAFDGVHLGHQALLGRMRELARRHELPAVVITFDPPPKTVFLGSKFLTSWEEKLHYLEAFQPQAVVAVPFDEDYAKTPKSAFLEGLRRIEPRIIIVGEDFRFGKDRAGGLDDLSHVTPKLEVFGIERLGGVPVKSSLIRALLDDGDVREAGRFLGHPYIAMGEVVEGDKRGRTVGYPTANVRLSRLKALPLGVYAVWIEAGVEAHVGRFAGMANVGPRPSFPDDPPALEAHLFDFSGDLYGQRIAVAFEKLLRGQKRFDGLDELKAQLQEDERQARALLLE